jgi:cytochrome c peroxidase
MFVRALVLLAALFVAAVGLEKALAFPIDGDQSVLPAGTELNEDSLRVPREAFHSEVLRGRKSYMINLGDTAFNSPNILGDVARRAGISCGTCHVNGASNPKFYVPGLSTKPGTFDTTGHLFNPKADNHVLDAVRIPSLRGLRSLAPYGNDGRTASLRDFIRNVIVGEFAGPEPSADILDGLVAYLNDIDFLYNPRLGVGGRLHANASDAEKRGEALFNRPFPHDPTLSCATCHVPSAAFVDHMQHDVGTGGLFKTPTLVNSDFNAPYFHDGRFDTFDQVVGYFDRRFDLGLSAEDAKDLVAYLTAAGNGAQPYDTGGAANVARETNDFMSVLAIAIPAHDNDVIAFTVDTVGRELRELTERFPDRRDTSVSGGMKERLLARRALKEVVLIVRRIGVEAADGRYDDAAEDYKTYYRLMLAGVPTALGFAERWSLFNPAIHDAHYGALRALLQARMPAQR